MSVCMTPVQQGHRLEVTITRDDTIGNDAVQICMEGLRRSPHKTDRAICEQIVSQDTSGITVVRFSVDPSAAARIEQHIRHVVTAARTYPSLAYSHLHQMLSRALGMRVVEVQTH